MDTLAQMGFTVEEQETIKTMASGIPCDPIELGRFIAANRSLAANLRAAVEISSHEAIQKRLAKLPLDGEQEE